jgi:hypothetical protein
MSNAGQGLSAGRARTGVSRPQQALGPYGGETRTAVDTRALYGRLQTGEGQRRIRSIPMQVPTLTPAEPSSAAYNVARTAPS